MGDQPTENSTIKGEVNNGYAPDDDDEDISTSSISSKTDVEQEDEKRSDDVVQTAVIDLSLAKREQRRIWKNVLAISLSFMCLFTAYGVVASLQSTINSEGGLGTIAEATVYVAQIISSLFMSTWVMQLLGLKWAMVVSQLCYSIYISVQFYPTFYTLIPGAIMIGFGAAPLWSSQGVYFTKAGERYNELERSNKENNKGTAEVHISRFFGFFFMLVATSAIWGNLISSLVLSSGATGNVTVITDERLGYCGADFCAREWNNYTSVTASNASSSQHWRAVALSIPADDERGGSRTSNNDENRPDNINTLMGILLGFSLLSAAVIAIAVDPPPKSDEVTKDMKKRSNKEAVLATFKHIKDRYMLLMIPLTLWPGFELGFLLANFTYAFIACAWGVEHIGYVLICYGTMSAIGAILCGALVKVVGRIPIFLFGAVTNFGLLVGMLFFWQPSPYEPVLFFVFAGLGGLADSVWQTQLNAFYGVIFKEKKEPAFSNFRLWNSVGFAIAFSYSTFLCVNVQLCILMGILLTGMTGYLTIEVLENRKKKKTSGKAEEKA